MLSDNDPFGHGLLSPSMRCPVVFEEEEEDPREGATSPESVPSMDATTASYSPGGPVSPRSLLDVSAFDEVDDSSESDQDEDQVFMPQSPPPMPPLMPNYEACANPWMCVLNLDGDSSDEEIDNFSSAGCQDFYSDGLLPMFLDWLSPGQEDHGKQRTLTMTAAADEENTTCSQSHPSRIRQREEMGRFPSTKKAATFLYAAREDFESVCLSLLSLANALCSRFLFLRTPFLRSAFMTLLTHPLSCLSFRILRNQHSQLKTTRTVVVPQVQQTQCLYHLVLQLKWPPTSLMRLRKDLPRSRVHVEDRWQQTWNKFECRYRVPIVRL